MVAFFQTSYQITEINHQYSLSVLIRDYFQISGNPSTIFCPRLLQADQVDAGRGLGYGRHPQLAAVLRLQPQVSSAISVVRPVRYLWNTRYSTSGKVTKLRPRPPAIKFNFINDIFTKHCKIWLLRIKRM